MKKAGKIQARLFQTSDVIKKAIYVFIKRRVLLINNIFKLSAFLLRASLQNFIADFIICSF